MSKRSLLALLLLLCLAFSCIPAQASVQRGGVDVRIYLRRLGLTDRADLVLDGFYTAATSGTEATMRFPQGSKITLQIRENNIYLYYAGLTMNVGQKITFIRNQ